MPPLYITHSNTSTHEALSNCQTVGHWDRGDICLVLSLSLIHTHAQMEREIEMKQSKFKRICVFCGSSPGKKSTYRDAAIELGRELVMSLCNGSLFSFLFSFYMCSNLFKLFFNKSWFLWWCLPGIKSTAVQNFLTKM